MSEQKKTCAEVAAHFVEKRSAEYANGFEVYDFWIICFTACSDFPQPKKKKQVWQWRARTKKNNWIIASTLMDEERAAIIYNGQPKFFSTYEKHAGPFEVEE